MPRLEREMIFTRPVAEVFEFFCKPDNLVQLAPPDLHLRLLEGPGKLHLGARLAYKGRRRGLPQRSATEITAFEADRLIVEEQRQGPLGKWVHTLHFEPLARGCRVREEIEYEAPGGMLGRVITADWLARELERVGAYRAAKLREHLGEPPVPE